MRKLWLRRRAVSTMIGGIIVLALFLTALVAMIIVTQQYDAYQAAINRAQQKYVDRLSEKLVGTYPGIEGPTAIGNINQYTMLVSNPSGIVNNVVRIYINSSIASGCYPAACLLTPSSSSSPQLNTFNIFQSYVNPGEFSHKIILWLPNTVNMQEADRSGSHSITIVTSRGRVFTFHFPFPPVQGLGSGGQGGTGLFIGPLVIIYQQLLISYTTNNQIQPLLPISPGWQFPEKQDIIFFIEVRSQGLNNVIMTAQSVFQVQQYGNPGSLQNFWLVAPMSVSMCTNYVRSFVADIDCSSSFVGGNEKPSTLAKYSSSYPYTIQFNQTGRGKCCGQPVYLLFSAKDPNPTGQISAQQIPQNYKGPIATFLNLVFQYDDGTGQGTFTWGVTLPFIAGCAGTFSSDCQP